MEYNYAIRDRETKRVHTSRYSCVDDAMSALEELAYELEAELHEFEIIKL